MLITKDRPIYSILVAGTMIAAALFFMMPVAVNAVTSISQGYYVTDKVSQGSIVSLLNNSTDHVIPTTVNNVDSILGIAINDGSSLIKLLNGEEKQIQVATNGMTTVLVSDINGTISQGDQITASPIKGVGMKATGNTKVVGIAQGTPIEGTTKASYKDADGREQTITLGQVPILINVAYYFKEPEKTIIPSAIQSLANAIAGKSVSTLPILISAAIFLVTIIVVAVIVYSMIKNSIISIGRNPMSQSAVYRDVIQLSALVLGIMSVSMISIYIILTRL